MGDDMTLTKCEGYQAEDRLKRASICHKAPRPYSLKL